MGAAPFVCIYMAPFSFRSQVMCLYCSVLNPLYHGSRKQGRWVLHVCLFVSAGTL